MKFFIESDNAKIVLSIGRGRERLKYNHSANCLQNVHAFHINATIQVDKKILSSGRGREWQKYTPDRNISKKIYISIICPSINERLGNTKIHPLFESFTNYSQPDSYSLHKREVGKHENIPLEHLFYKKVINFILPQ